MHTISIIIPTYNRRHLIGTTINNLLSQTQPATEIIVVDDHSTDGTLEWLEQTYGNKLTLLTNTGKGPGAARNAGLRVATGEYIKFFDSDDVMTANTLEVQLQTLIETGKPFVTSPYYYASETNGVWTPTDNIIINYHGFPQHNPLAHWMIWGLFIPIPGMMFRRNFLDKVGFWPEECVTSEDWQYLWRMAQYEPYPAHTAKCAFIYRVHPAQSTGENMNNEQRDREKFKILQTIYNQDIAKSNYSAFEKMLFRNKFYQMARVTSENNFKTELLKTAGNFQSLVWQYYRIKMKLGRIKTKCEWQVMHGVVNAGNIQKEYLF